MDRRPFISIVMPVYNAGKDVSRMIESIQVQTLEEWELIVVDDCSTDNTCEVIEEFCKLDNRIRLFRQEKNEGPGSAKNLGIKKTRGEYLTFADSDDWIERDTFSIIKENINSNTEIVIFGLYRDIYTQKGEMLESNEILSPIVKMKCKEDVLKMVPSLDQQRLFAYACNKVYRKDIVDRNNVRFSDKRFGEDYDFNISFFNYINNGIILDKAFYHYIKKNSESLTEKYLPDYYKINLDRFLKMKKLMVDNGGYNENVRQMIMTSYIRHLLMAAARLYDKRGNIKRKARIEKVKKMLNENLTKEAIEYSKANTLSGKVCNGVLKTKSVYLILLFGKALWWIQNDAKGFYEKIKK